MSKFVHMELNTGDPRAAREFYGKLFGWRMRDVPMGDGSTYTLIEEIGGIQQKPMPDAPTKWVGYVGVDSVDASVAKIKALGGTVFMERTEVPGMGWFAVAADPTGGTFAVWEPSPVSAQAAGGEAAKKAKEKRGKPQKDEKKAEKDAGKKADKDAKKAKKDAKKDAKKAKKDAKRAEKNAKKAEKNAKKAKKKGKAKK